MPNASPDCFAGNVSFTQARGRPFVLWLNCADENDALAKEVEAVRAAAAHRALRSLFLNIDNNAGKALADFEKELERLGAIRDKVEHANKGLQPHQRQALPELPTLPLVVDNESRVAIVKDGKKLSDKVILGAIAARGEQDLWGERAVRLKNAKANLRTPPREVDGLVEPGAYYALDANRAERIQTAARAVAKLMGLAKADVDERGDVTLFPLARGKVNRATIALHRWAVLEYCAQAQEQRAHQVFLGDIGRAINHDHIEPFDPRTEKAADPKP